MAGFAMVVQMTSVSTLVQVITEDSKRGRVMSLFAMAFLGMTPIGNQLTGTLASAVDAETAFLLNGCICLAAALWFALRLSTIRGILQEGKDAAHEAGAWALHAEH